MFLIHIQGLSSFLYSKGHFLSGCWSTQSHKVLHVNHSRHHHHVEHQGSYPTGFFHSHRGGSFHNIPETWSGLVLMEMGCCDNESGDLRLRYWDRFRMTGRALVFMIWLADRLTFAVMMNPPLWQLDDRNCVCRLVCASLNLILIFGCQHWVKCCHYSEYNSGHYSAIFWKWWVFIWAQAKIKWLDKHCSHLRWN